MSPPETRYPATPTEYARVRPTLTQRVRWLFWHPAIHAAGIVLLGFFAIAALFETRANRERREAWNEINANIRRAEASASAERRAFWHDALKRLDVAMPAPASQPAE